MDEDRRATVLGPGGLGGRACQPPPADTERLAREHRVITVQWPNARVRDASTLLRFILLHVGADTPLWQTATLIPEAGARALRPCGSTGGYVARSPAWPLGSRS